VINAAIRFAVGAVGGSVILLMVAACSPGVDMSAQVLSEDLSADLELISTARIYFGHQSVGGNIIDGLKNLQSGSNGPRLRIAELGDLTPIREGGALVHTKVGRNEEPLSKCEDFRRILDGQMAGRVDVALLKFCYIDFSPDTDVKAVFAEYRRTMEDLEQRHPDTLFIHVTAPLRYSADDLGTWIREMLGRPNQSKLANIKRNEFNQLLKVTFPNDPVFDLAASESTYPDGRRELFKKDGKTYYGMVGAYTDDGGHLNEVGRSYVAADFVRSVADALREKKRADS
jgi:hypothetical protein